MINSNLTVIMYVHIYTVMMSNVAYITTEVDESRDYATLHTARNTEDSCQSKPVVCVGRGYNHLQRESVKSSIISSGDGHLSYSNIDSTAQYLVCVYNVMCLVLMYYGTRRISSMLKCNTILSVVVLGRLIYTLID